MGRGVLLGRGDEQAQLYELLANARNGRGGSVVIIGEPGIGKTALLDDLAARPGGRHVRLDGYESEASIPFAAVHRLTLPLRVHFSSLPPRHREALEVAAGEVEGPAPDRYLVGLGVLGLLTAAAAEAPVVCLIDDAHLLDVESMEALAFVARRLEVEPVAVVFTARTDGEVAERMGGVPELTLTGLDITSALALLGRSVAAPLDPAVAVAVADATGRNPLALIELGEELSTQDLGSTTLAGDPVPIGPHLEAHYARRARQADPDVQEWLLLAAADTTNSPELVGEAAKTLGLNDDVRDRAESVGLVALDTTIRFRHALVRSAVYNAADGAERRRVHRALASAAQRLELVELEAWHAAKATVGTDVAVAERLEYAADLAARRGGFASRASILTRAAELTPVGDEHDARLVAAAEAALAVGAAQVAKALLDRLPDEVSNPITRGRAIVVAMSIGLFLADGSTAYATERLVAAADEFHGHDPDREQQALLAAFQTCQVADSSNLNITQERLGHRLDAGAKVMPGPWSVVLRGLAAVIRSPYDEAVPAARAALDTMAQLPVEDSMRFGSAITALAVFLWDQEGCLAALDRAAAAAREGGRLQDLDSLLWVNALTEATRGSIRRAQQYDEMVRDVRRAMGYDGENVVNAALMALTGAAPSIVLMIAEGAKAIGFGGVASSAYAALAVCDIARRDYRDAYERLRPMVEAPFLHVGPTYYPDYVEAAHRSGHAVEATRYAHALSALADDNGSPTCRGVAERSLALVDSSDGGEPRYLAAIEALTGTRAEIDLARTHLVYGEWLRRAKRRREASEQLHCALTIFEDEGGDVFVARTRAELEAAGGKANTPRQRHSTDLTAQELSIGRLAADGHTNVEIAAKLFVSPNTVDYHLRKVFQKLGVSSRRQLADHLSTLAE